MRVLSLCDLTGNMVRPWAQAGHECMIVDIQHAKSRLGKNVFEPNITALDWDIGHQWYADVLASHQYDVVFAFPPCTDLSKAGASHWQKKGLGVFIDALKLVKNCLDICESATRLWMLENPSGRLSSCWQKPNYRFDPYHYAGYLEDPIEQRKEAHKKGTCLWTSESFVMPMHKPVECAQGSWVNSFGETKDRANKRSATPKGFAQAVFEANRKCTYDTEYRTVSTREIEAKQ